MGSKMNDANQYFKHSESKLVSLFNIYLFILNLLGWHWFTKLYRFQVYNSTKPICTLHRAPITQRKVPFHPSSFSPSLPTSTYLHPTFPSGYHHSVVYVYVIYIIYTMSRKCPTIVNMGEWFAWHGCNLAAKESGQECASMNNDDCTVLVSGGGKCWWVSMCTVWPLHSKW